LEQLGFYRASWLWEDEASTQLITPYASQLLFVSSNRGDLLALFNSYINLNQCHDYLQNPTIQKIAGQLITEKPSQPQALLTITSDSNINPVIEKLADRGIINYLHLEIKEYEELLKGVLTKNDRERVEKILENTKKRLKQFKENKKCWYPCGTDKAPCPYDRMTCRSNHEGAPYLGVHNRYSAHSGHDILDNKKWIYSAVWIERGLRPPIPPLWRDNTEPTTPNQSKSTEPPKKRQRIG
jgi:hypothetical protein